MTKFMPVLFAAMLIATPALAQKTNMDGPYVPPQKAATIPTKDALKQPANPTSSNVGEPIERGSEPGLRSVSEANRLAGGSNAAVTGRTTIGVLNGDEKNDSDYVLFWPDWESDLVTPTNFNK